MQNWFEGNLRIRGAIKQIRESMHLLVADNEVHQMDIYHVSRSTIAVTESFTSGKKMPIEEGFEVVFLAARLRSEIFPCKYLFTISSFNSVEYFFFPDIIKITPFIRHLFCLTKGALHFWGQ